MKNKYLILSAIVLTAAVACTTENEYPAPDKNKYIYDIPQTTLASDAVVGAYYTNYTSAVSSTKSAEPPTLGWYKTADEGVMAQHVAWADAAALDFFIFSWNASSSDNDLIALFKANRGADTNVKYVINYNTGHLSLTNDAPLESTAKYNAMLTDFVDTIAALMKDDAYYKIDGKPVMLITPSNLSSSALLSADYSEVIPKLKNDMHSFYGIDLYIIGEMTTGWVAPVNYSDHQVYSFDGLTLNAWKTRSYDVFFGYFSFLDINWRNWQTTLAKRNVDFVPCIYPSYNDRVSSSSSYYYTFSENGEPDDYIDFCNVAKRNIGSRNVVLLNSWNDWNNGTNLEPSALKETEFLNVTKTQFKH